MRARAIAALPNDTAPVGWGPCAISEDGRHRYTLARSFDSLFSHRRVLWVMLNPSTADDSVDDPTIRRVRDFSLRLGFGAFAVANLFSLRSTDPKGIREDGAEGDPENLIWIAELAANAETIICAWGAHGSLRGRDRRVLTLLREDGHAHKLRCLGYTKSGAPRHPLYLAGDTELQPFDVPRVKEVTTDLEEFSDVKVFVGGVELTGVQSVEFSPRLGRRRSKR
jgi:hypothetical protein